MFATSVMRKLGKPFLSLLCFVLIIKYIPLLLIVKDHESFVESKSLEWWKETVIYQIYPRSFQDSDDDGIGDLKGILSRLDYFVYLGVKTIWLSPIYKSPMKDFGYDISNYTDIDPRFGTLSDFGELVKQMRARGIKLIMDFIPNHTSDQHEWFQKSVNRIEPYTDYYTWKDPKGIDESGNRIPPNNWISVFGGSMWEWNEERGQFYLHQYAKEQPDLKLDNSKVESELFAVMRFWLDLGVDGFRMDAVPRMFEDQYFRDQPKATNIMPGISPNRHQYWSRVYTFDLPETLDTLAGFREWLDKYSVVDGHKRIMMTEGYVSPVSNVMKYYGTETKPIAHFPFNFGLLQLRTNFTSKDLKNTIDGWMSNMPDGQWANWVTGNHDNFRIATRHGREMVDAFNMMALLLPGTAVTYYGEEIGMQNTELSWEQTVDPAGRNAGPERYKFHSRDPERTPMQWNSEKNAGFTNAETTWLPLNRNYEDVNVESEKMSTESHLKVYKLCVALRGTDAGKFGHLETKTFPGTNAFGFTRIYNGHGFMVLINIEQSKITLDASGFTNIPNAGRLYTRSVGLEENSVTIGSDISISSVKVPAKSSVVLTF